MKPAKQMTEGQRAYEAKRAAKAGLSLEKWLAAKERDRLAEEKAKPKAVEATETGRNPLGFFKRLLERAQKPLNPELSSPRTPIGVSILASTGSPSPAGTARDGDLAAPRPVGDPAIVPRCAAEEAVARRLHLAWICRSACREHTRAQRPEAGFLGFLETIRRLARFFPRLRGVDRSPPRSALLSGARCQRHDPRLRMPPPSTLGLATGLSRLCDRATAERPAGAPLFWTLGANQSGKAAIAAWRDMLLPALATGPGLRVWPFEGPFRAMLRPGTVVMAETYPAEAIRHLALKLRGSKRRQSDRAALAQPLLAAMARLNAAPDPALIDALTDGFGRDPAGEDRFDCVLGVLCVSTSWREPAGHRA